MHDGAAEIKGAWESFAARHGNSRSLAALLALAVLCCLLMPLYNVVDYDVAFLAWAADKVLGGAVYGRDILDVNPPLGMLIYMPAALLSPLTGLEWGVRLWMLALSLLSIACLWHCAGQALRLPLAAMLLAFVTLAFPNHFAQREQIVLLLCAPYVAGPAQDRRWGLVSGMMAGVGFLMKPHFLIPLAAIMALRRRIGTEERVIAATGVLYGFVLLAFFQPYLREMLPAAAATYGAISLPWEYSAVQAALVLVPVSLVALGGAPQPAARSFLAATLGFTLAALLQGKGFINHFIPAYGFMALFLTTETCRAGGRASLIAGSFLILQVVLTGRFTTAWFAYDRASSPTLSLLREEIDHSRSYASFIPEPVAAFPAALHTRSSFAGIAISPIFIQAVARDAAGLAQGDPAIARRMALSQALRELANRPELVITLNKPYNVEGRSFDILAWLNADAAFREAWKAYAPDRDIGHYRLYRRK